MSDSQAAINALNYHTINSKMVQEGLEKLNELGRNNTVTLLWVPRHTGVEGNEIADALAKKGAETPFLEPEPFCGISASTILDQLKWCTDCSRTSEGTEIEIYGPGPNIPKVQANLRVFSKLKFMPSENVSSSIQKEIFVDKRSLSCRTAKQPSTL